jgi:hypothetical protein
MEGVEDDVGTGGLKLRRQIAAGVDAAHPRAQALKGVGARAPRHQAHLALRRKAAEEDRDGAIRKG